MAHEEGSSSLIAPRKPKNARSKRAMKAREPVLVEKGGKTALFVRGSTTSDRVRKAMSELSLLKKPHSENFNKSNEIRPFEDASSLEFFSEKNDASLFLVGGHNKKRPHNLTFARTFSHQIMDMFELGIDEFTSMNDIPGTKSSPGTAPLFIFNSVAPYDDYWTTDPSFTHLKSLLLDFFRPIESDGVALKGIERVMAFTIVPGLTEEKPRVELRVYSVEMLRSGVRSPIVNLKPHGPNMTLSLRRREEPKAALWKEAMKKSAPKSAEKKKQRKNVDINEMGDKVGRIHMTKQDLSQLQARKFAGLKRHRDHLVESPPKRSRSDSEDESDDEA